MGRNSLSSEELELGLRAFTRGVGVCILVHGLLYLWEGRFLFSLSSGMLDRQRVIPFFSSLLDFLPNDYFRYALLVAYSFGGLLMVRLYQLVWTIPFVWILHISLHHFNPYIVHEPQQILSVFLLFLLLAHSFRFRCDIVVRSLQFWLVAYYLFAGGKKLLDPAWRDGTAMAEILAQPMLTQPFVGQLLLSPWQSIVLTYSTLFFELGFALVFWPRLRRSLLVFGVLFHWVSLAFLAIGTFPLVMSAWYLLFLKRDDLPSAFRKRITGEERKA